MSKQILLDQVVLEFRGDRKTPRQDVRRLHRKLKGVKWRTVLKPMLESLGTRIRVENAS